MCYGYYIPLARTRRGKIEKCEYFCFQARLMQASNVERQFYRAFGTVR